MFACPRCKSSDGYFPGQKCLHCSYVETNKQIIERAKVQQQSQFHLASCPRCKCPDAYTPGKRCMHCGYTETDPRIIQLAMDAQNLTPRSAFLKCPRCKCPDAYTVGEKCLHCGYIETNGLLVKRAKELRYRLIPLMRQREFVRGIDVTFSRSRRKYDPIAGLLLDYEYAFPLLFDSRVVLIQAYQNLYRILFDLGVAIQEVFKESLNDTNKALVGTVMETASKQFAAVRFELQKNSWAVQKFSCKPRYPRHTSAIDYFARATTVTDVLGALNGAAAAGFHAANLFWGVAETTMDTMSDVTGVAGLAMAPLGIAENINRGRRDAKLQKQFTGSALAAGETILDLPEAKQKQMIMDAMNPQVTSSMFAAKWGGRIHYSNIKAWKDAAETHKQGKSRRTKRAVATAVGAGLVVGSMIVTCGGTALILAAGATVISVCKLIDAGVAAKSKKSKSEIREEAAASIVSAAATGDDSAIQLLIGLDLIGNHQHSKYLDFSDIFVPTVEKMKAYLDPA